MPRNYEVLDLMRIQTVVNVLSNEACWTYAAQPDKIDDIINKLSEALGALRGLALVGTYACPPRYCPEKGRCVPCELLPRRLGSLRKKPLANRSSASLQTKPSRRGTRAPSPGREQTRPRGR